MKNCYYGVTAWVGYELSTIQYLYNPGSGIVGHTDIITKILKRMVLHEMAYADPLCDANMAQYAKTMHKMSINGTIHILNLTDWNSRFKAYENYTDHKFVIYHKQHNYILIKLDDNKKKID